MSSSLAKLIKEHERKLFRDCGNFVINYLTILNRKGPPMTTDDVLKEAPTEGAYQRTNEIRWFVGRANFLEDEERILAQKMVSDYKSFSDVWVAVPETILPPPKPKDYE